MESLKFTLLNSSIKVNRLSAILLCFVYGYLGYFLVRSDFYLFIILVTLAFIITYFLIEKSNFNFTQLLWLSIIYKLIFIGAVPQLSQDFFRFFWDGQLMLNGVNPYLQNVDSYFVQNPNYTIQQAEVLRQGMGSLNASNYSNYPPFSQFLYMISAWFANASTFAFICSLKLILIGFDLVFIFFARKILIHFNKNPRVLFWYALSPLCILEITGNLHLEGVMIALFVACIFALLKQRYLLSGILLSLSVGTKLLSIIAIPLILVFLWRKTKGYKKYLQIGGFMTGFSVVLVLQLLPFLDNTFFENYTQTIALWFGKFEFNASIYYLVRAIGFKVYGYNIIQTYGAIMPWVTILFFLFFIYQTKAKTGSILTNFMWMLSVYFLLSTTVHPWYILFPLALSVFTNYKFVYLWSFLVFLSYSAYRNTYIEESLFILFLEYILVLLYAGYELFKNRFNPVK